MSEGKKKLLKVVMVGLLKLKGKGLVWCYVDFKDRKKEFNSFYSLSGRRSTDWLKEIGGIYTVSVNVDTGGYDGKSFEHTEETIEEKDLIENWRLRSAVYEDERRRAKANYKVDNKPKIMAKLQPLIDFYIPLNYEEQEAFRSMVSRELQRAAQQERLDKVLAEAKRREKTFKKKKDQQDAEVDKRITKAQKKIGAVVAKAGKDAVKKHKDEEKKKKAKKKKASKKGGK